MPLVLDVTISGPSANSYATLAEAEAAVAVMFPSPPGWASVSPDDKNRALYQARLDLDREHFAGDRYLTTQACAWPRTRVLRPGGAGSYYGLGTGYQSYYLPTEIPDAVKQAQIARAVYLVEQVVTNGGALPDDDLTGVASVNIGSEIAITFDTSLAAQSDRDRHFAQSIRPILGSLVYAPQPRMVRG